MTEDEKELPSIMQLLFGCSVCNWTGELYLCEPDVDGDGNLGCPECFEIAYQVVQ